VVLNYAKWGGRIPGEGRGLCKGPVMGTKEKPVSSEHKEEKEMGLQSRDHTIQGCVVFTEALNLHSTNSGKPLKDFKQKGNMTSCSGDQHSSWRPVLDPQLLCFMPRLEQRQACSIVASTFSRPCRPVVLQVWFPDHQLQCHLRAYLDFQILRTHPNLRNQTLWGQSPAICFTKPQ